MFDKSNISDIFWDLDHTIWDYPTNAKITIFELFEKYNLNNLTIHSPEVFHKTYCKYNDSAWDEYRKGKIDKLTLRKLRFSNTFKELKIEKEEFHDIFEIEFVKICPTKGNLMKGALNALQFFEPLFKQHIITNGFKETQELKLKSSGISHFFDSITNSEDVGVQKPSPIIFEKAVSGALADKNKCIMIGDNYEADIVGAYNYGLKCVFYNHSGIEIKNIPSEIIVVDDLDVLRNMFY